MNQTSQLLAKFLTRNKKYSIDEESPYSIPSKSNGDSLNLLIKSILVEKNKKLDEFGNEDENSKNLIKSSLDEVEFDFFINGDFLDSTLDNFLLKNPSIKTV